MSYATTNPPVLHNQAIAGLRVWAYSSSDPTGTVDGAGYFTNGYQLGMRAGDLVICSDSVNSLVSMSRVAAAVSTSVDLGTGTSIGSSANAD